MGEVLAGLLMVAYRKTFTYQRVSSICISCVYESLFRVLFMSFDEVNFLKFYGLIL